MFVPDRKELHFFGTDLGFKNDRSVETYQKNFDAWQSEPVGGEASVWYLHSQLAAQEIHDFKPDAKIIIMLRNPTEMVYAQHSQAVYVGRETITDFEAALDAEESRRKGKLKTHPLSPPEVFNYSEIARYTEQIKRYVDLFGRDQIHFVIFDDLKADAETVFEGVLKFLGVSTTHNVSLAPRNKNRRFKNKRLHYLVNNPPPVLRSVIKGLLPSGIFKWTKTKLQKVNTSRRPRDKMSEHVKVRLEAIYRDEVKTLGEYLGRDLSHWSGQESGS